MGHRQVADGDWFVLDLAGRHRLVLVQIEGTGDDAFGGLLALLVAAWGSGVLVLVGVVLVLKLASSAASSASTAASAPPPSSTWRQALRLLSGYGRCHR